MTTTSPPTQRQSERTDAVIGLVAVCVALLVIVGMLSGDLKSLFSSGPGRTITATFASTQQLQTGAPVDLDGVPVGQVQQISLLPGGHAARVRMSVAASAGPLYANASATVRWRTVLGGAFKISLTRGEPITGPLRVTGIPLAHTSDQIELEDVTSIVRGPARSGLRTMPRELTRALRNPADPAGALSELAAVSPAVQAGVGALRGTITATDLPDLITDTATAVRALDASNAQVKQLISSGAAVLSTTDLHRDGITSALQVAPRTLTAVRVTLGQLDRTLADANPLIAHLLPPAQQVAPTVTQLRPTVIGADRLLRQARPLLAELRPALASLAHTSGPALALVNSAVPSLDRIDHTVLPYMNEIDPETKHSAAEMVGPALEGLGPWMNGGEDDNGHIVRFPATVGSESLYLPCQTTFGNPDDHGALLQCESLQDALNAVASYSPTSLTGTAP